MNDESVIFQQILHGYLNGHRLIESSFDLTNSIKRLMLNLSDLSGPRILPGFESYLTGYPINDIEKYAFAKTWYAPEMSRPGCVWTHTLLINFSDFANINNLFILLKLFKRPNKFNDFSDFNKPINFDELMSLNYNYNNIKDKISYSRMFNSIFSLFYRFPSKSLIIPSYDSIEYENFIIELWSKQWIKLKQNFTFCTGSISNRSINGKTFDIQIVPFGNLHNIKRELKDDIIFFDKNNIKTDFSFDNLELNTNLLKSKEYYEFIKNYFNDINGGRERFFDILKTYLMINIVKDNKSQLHELTKIIAEYFLTSKEAVKLKNDIYGYQVGNELLFRNITEYDIIFELLTCEEFNCFDIENLNIEQRAINLWNMSRKETIELIIKIRNSDYNILFEKFLEGIVKVIDTDYAIELAKAKSELLFFFISKNPYLAVSSVLWQQNNDIQHEIFATLDKSIDRNNDLWEKIIPSIIEAKSNSLATEIIDKLNGTAIRSIIRWFNNKEIPTTELLSHEWKKALTSRRQLITDYLTNNKSSSNNELLFYSSILDPHNPDVQKKYDQWIKFANYISTYSNAKSKIEAMAFLLTMGFDNIENGAEQLVSKSFEIVHYALANQILSNYSWKLLEDQLPSFFWDNWDKCERLRQGLIDKYILYNWSYSSFLDAVKNESVIYHIIKYCKKSKKGKYFLKGIKKYVSENDIEISETQQNFMK